MLSIVQLSRFFLCSFSSDSFYILPKALSFVKNFFNFFHFLFCEAFSQRVSSYIISFVSVFVKNFFFFFQKLFWYYFDTLFSRFLNYGLQFSPNIRQDFSRIKRRRRDLNPRAATNDLLPFQGSPFSQLGYFSKNGEGGIRTHAPFRTNGFQDRLVMTTSIPLHIYNSENRLIELPLCNVRYDITCTFPMSRPYFIFYRFFCFFP